MTNVDFLQNRTGKSHFPLFDKKSHVWSLRRKVPNTASIYAPICVPIPAHDNNTCNHSVIRTQLPSRVRSVHVEISFLGWEFALGLVMLPFSLLAAPGEEVELPPSLEGLNYSIPFFAGTEIDPDSIPSGITKARFSTLVHQSVTLSRLQTAFGPPVPSGVHSSR